MAKAKTKKTTKSAQPKVDLSKVETPTNQSLSNQLVLDTIHEMVAARQKENPKHPHVGVNEVATQISESTSLQVDGADVRRRLQKIRKKGEGYKRGKTGEVSLAPENSQNPYEKPMVIQWADRNDRTKGIEYLVSLG